MNRRSKIVVLVSLFVGFQFFPTALITAEEVQKQTTSVASSSASINDSDEDEASKSGELENVEKKTEEASDSASASESAKTVESEEDIELAEATDSAEVTDPLEPTQSDESKNNDAPIATQSAIKTGDATATANITNELNTNIVADEYVFSVVNHTAGTTEELDFSEYEIRCLTDGNKLDGDKKKITITNTADVVNEVTVTANTGENEASGSISTGDAVAQANIFNLINTNVVGDCWYFGVFNVFDEYIGNITLPYEDQFISQEEAKTDATTADASSSAQVSSEVSVDNSAQVTEHINADANSGNNTSEDEGAIHTGDTESNVQVIDTLNTNYAGSNWLLVEVMNPHYWHGTFDGHDPTYSYLGDSLFFWLPPGDQNSSTTQKAESVSAEKSVQITNTAVVNNTVTTKANTGNNTAYGPKTHVHTGTATSKINIGNMVNTNIVGNNWYYVALNLFDTFTGNVVFPRADVQIELSAQKDTVTPGETMVLTAQIANTGRITARDTTVAVTIPPKMSVLESGVGGVVANNRVVWQTGDLQVGKQRYYQLHLKASESVVTGEKVTFTGVVETQTKESQVGNNNDAFSVLLEILKKQPVGGLRSTPDLDPELDSNSELLKVQDYLIEPVIFSETVTRTTSSGQVLAAVDSNPLVDTVSAISAVSGPSMCFDTTFLQCRVPTSTPTVSNAYWHSLFTAIGNFLTMLLQNPG